MQTLLDPHFWLFFLSLLAVIYLLKRHTFREAYVKGVSYGFALGISESIEVLIERNLVKINGKVCSRNELIDYLTPLATDKLVKKIK